MSKENPGVIFDASNSWNGYNHQGKLAILFAIKQILEVYDKSLSTEENKKILKSYWMRRLDFPKSDWLITVHK